MKYNKLSTAQGFISFELVNSLLPDEDYKLVIKPNLQDQIGVYHDATTEIPFHTTANVITTSGSLADRMEELSFNYEPDAGLFVTNASVFLNKEHKYNGYGSNELRYTFSPNEPDAVAYYRYTGAFFDGNSRCKIGMYVFSDFSQNELQAVWDASGDIQYTPVTVLDYAGWHYETADLTLLPEGVDYQFMGLRIVRHEGFMSESGSVFIDDIWFERNAPSAIDYQQSVNSEQPYKIIHNGHIYIIRGNKIFTLTGEEIK